MRHRKEKARRGAAEAKRSRLFLILPLLALLTAATFWRVRENDFVSYDDPEFVTSNATVREGLTGRGVVWAFQKPVLANWHPLTILSHMADVSLFGLNPSGHHTTNLLLHVANTLLLFLLLRRMTGEDWRSAWVAALFAVHPAHVESVAWIAERKDLLSTLFWLATTWAYAAWVRDRRPARYAAVLVLFAAGLMSKPMLVSLPLVLLLLDDWPLARLDREGGLPALWRSSSGGRPGLVLEKAPLFAMAAAFSAVTFLVQRAGGAVRSGEVFPLWTRVANACVAYVRYLRVLVWPARLGVFYPHPGTAVRIGEAAAALVLLLAISAAAVLLRRKAPYLFMGWFWFLITLVPVIGLVQVGLQAMADRYTYIPYIGLFVAVAWGVPAPAPESRALRAALAAAALAAVVALGLAAMAQVRFWKNSETLYLRALEVTGDNATIQNNLGDYYNDIRKPDKAMGHLAEALRIKPKGSEILNNLGRALLQMGRYDEAEKHFEESLRLEPNRTIPMNNLARTRFLQGDVAGAIRFYRATIALDPRIPDVRMRLGIALLLDGKTAVGREELEQASRLQPSNPEYRSLADGVVALEKDRRDPRGEELRRVLAEAHREVAEGLQRGGRRAEAVTHLDQAVALVPADAGARLDLGALLAEQGRWDEAEEQFRAVLVLDPGSALAHTDLGYVLYRKGRREAAIQEHREALRLQPGFPLALGNLDLALRAAGEPEKPRSQP